VAFKSNLSYYVCFIYLFSPAVGYLQTGLMITDWVQVNWLLIMGSG